MRSRATSLFVVALGLSLACRQDMHDQPRYEPYEVSDLFADGMASRPPVAGTVARGQLREDLVFESGHDAAGNPVTALPVPVSLPLLRRGQERFDIFCSPCHDRVGSGRGMVVQRGFKQPTSFHVDRLRAAPVGYFFDVMTNGFGTMSSYASQLSAADRWAVVAYLRTLQWSQAARLEDLPEVDRQELSQLPRQTAR